MYAKMGNGKTVHLLRHAEGYHNVQGEIFVQLLDFKSVILQGRWSARRLRIHHLVRIVCCIWRLLCGLVIRAIVVGKGPLGNVKSQAAKSTTYEHLDASLTAIGWKQVADRGKHVAKSGIELVVVSPLTRTLQKAAGVFGGGEYRQDEKLPPLMTSKVGRCPQPAISSAGSPPVLAIELCREHISNFPCDQRSRLSKCKMEFPGIDFSKIEGEEDVLWKATCIESQEELYARVKAFVEWLWSRPENEIAVVSHGGFLYTMLSLYGGANVARFNNCELRTVNMRKSEDSIVFETKSTENTML